MLSSGVKLYDRLSACFAPTFATLVACVYVGEFVELCLEV